MNKLLLSLTLIIASPVLAQDFVKDIAPILEASCVKCHNDTKGKGKLSLESKAGAMKGGKDTAGKVIVAGKPDESAMLKSIMLPETDEETMPPKGKGPRPDAAQIELLKKWIAAGAAWPDDAKVKVPAPPAPPAK